MNNITIRDERWSDKARELMRTKQMVKHYQALEDQLERELKVLSEQTNSTYGNLKYTYTVAKGSIDYKAIPELKSVDLELYRKEETVRWKLEYTELGNIYNV